nr:probable basic-leucine zipper transcription factor R [Rhipicephalus microplus]
MGDAFGANEIRAHVVKVVTTPCSPAAVELTGEPCNKEKEEQQHHHQQQQQQQQQQQEQQQLQPQPPPAARQRVPVTASTGIRGLQSMGLQSLSMRQMYEFEIRQRELAVKNRTLDIEERRLALEESKVALGEIKNELEVTSRQQQRLDFVKHMEQMFDKLSQED